MKICLAGLLLLVGALVSFASGESLNRVRVTGFFIAWSSEKKMIDLDRSAAVTVNLLYNRLDPYLQPEGELCERVANLNEALSKFHISAMSAQLHIGIPQNEIPEQARTDGAYRGPLQGFVLRFKGSREECAVASREDILLHNQRFHAHLESCADLCGG